MSKVGVFETLRNTKRSSEEVIDVDATVRQPQAAAPVCEALA